MGALIRQTEPMIDLLEKGTDPASCLAVSAGKTEACAGSRRSRTQSPADGR